MVAFYKRKKRPLLPQKYERFTSAQQGELMGIDKAIARTAATQAAVEPMPAAPQPTAREAYPQTYSMIDQPIVPPAPEPEYRASLAQQALSKARAIGEQVAPTGAYDWPGKPLWEEELTPEQLESYATARTRRRVMGGLMSPEQAAEIEVARLERRWGREGVSATDREEAVKRWEGTLGPEQLATRAKSQAERAKSLAEAEMMKSPQYWKRQRALEEVKTMQGLLKDMPEGPEKSQLARQIFDAIREIGELIDTGPPPARGITIGQAPSPMERRGAAITAAQIGATVEDVRPLISKLARDNLNPGTLWPGSRATALGEMDKLVRTIEQEMGQAEPGAEQDAIKFKYQNEVDWDLLIENIRDWANADKEYSPRAQQFLNILRQWGLVMEAPMPTGFGGAPMYNPYPEVSEPGAF